MATKTINGAMQGSNSSYYDLKLECTSTSNQTTNTSNATVKLYFRRNKAHSYPAYNNYTDNVEGAKSSIKIDGTNSGNSITPFDTTNSGSGTSWILLKSYTKNNIQHNADGKKTISVSGTFNPNLGTDSLKTTTVSGTFTLDEIPRGSIIGELTSFNIEEPFTIPINTYLSTAYQVLKIYDIDNNLLTTINGIVGNQEVNLISLIGQNQLYQLTKNTNSYPFKFSLISYTDDDMETLLGVADEKTIHGLITNANPVFNDFSYTEADNEVFSLTNGLTYVKGYSDILISNLVATGPKGATIEYWNVNNNLIENTGSNNITIQDILTNSITIYAVDSRGNSAPLTKMISNFIDYSKITKGVQDYERIDNTTEQVRVSFEGTIKPCDFGVVENYISVSYRYKKTSNPNWTTGETVIEPTITNETYQFEDLIKGDTNLGFSIGNSYDLEIIVSDRLSSVVFSYLIQSGKPAIAYYGNKVALGDKYDENLDNFDTQLNNAICLDDFKVRGNIYGGENYDDKVLKESDLNGVVNIATLTSDFKAYSNDSSNVPRYTKLGNLVSICGVVSPAKAQNNLNTANETIIFTIPQEYRPKVDAYTICQGSGTCVFLFSVRKNGNITASRYRNGNAYPSSPPGTSTWLPFCITYLV